MDVANLFFSFFFNDTATTEIYTLSLHDALPICVGMRRAARHVEIDLKDILDPVALLRVAAEEPARYRAGAGGDDELGFANRFVRRERRLSHVRGQRAGDEDAVGVARRCYEFDAEAARIENHIAERVDFGFAAVASPGADLAQPQRAPEEPAQLATQRIDPGHTVAGRDEPSTLRCGETPVPRQGDRPLGAGGGALA